MPALPDEIRSLPRVFLREGQIVITSRPAVIQTVLGSCISVTLRDPVTGLCGMCHAAMPEAPDEESGSLRFADQAILRMVEHFSSRDVPASRLTAKLIGGADTRIEADKSQRPESVGARNVEVAVQRLAQHGLEAEASHVGGDRGRRVLFVVTTGDVFVHRLPRSFKRGQ